MPRIARAVATGFPHHVTQRGNYRQDVFFDDADRTLYLSFIQEYSQQNKLSVLAYCIMSNHVHFIVIPEEDTSLSNTFKLAHMRYSKHFNQKTGYGGGHLWQGRFYSCVLGQNHLLAAVRYVERNPVRAKLTDKPWLWRWSSCAYNCGEVSESLISLTGLSGYLAGSAFDWKAYVDSADYELFTTGLKRSTMTGRPMGAPDFVADVEKKLDRRLHALKRGRPLK
ncbi:MAG: transposase [Candidatus Auribacterota bacterium]